MKKIDKLVLKNFKVFRDQTFEFGGKNVLLYGNNGSGKSSLYWALYTFLQSSGKTNPELQDYFKHFVSTDPDTYRSLKNIFADTQEEVSVEMTYIEEDGTKTVKIISPSLINTIGNNTIQKANLASDFINYKLLQNFYNGTHKQEVNLWEVFWRDVFPYFEENGKSYREQMETLSLQSSGQLSKKTKETIDLINNNIEIFIGNIETRANEILKEHFFDKKDALKIQLEYKEKIDKKWIKNKSKASNNIPNGCQIILSTQIFDSQTGNWIPNYRPHSFLNEAQLTRIALAIRIGALFTRLNTDTIDFKILCLDDLLISLDMSNRRKVLELVFNSSSKFLEKYQIIFFTHDKTFQEVVKHYIDKLDQSSNWKFYEMFLDEYHSLKQPYIIDNSSDSITKARFYFSKYDYAACANTLRTEIEKVIKNYLPSNKIYAESNDGILKLKPLEKLIDELKKHFKDYDKSFTNIEDLYLYKDILLNPLSHDNLGTTVYQVELHTLIEEVIPEIQKLINKVVIELNDRYPTYIYLTEIDSDGIEWKYTILLLENWHEYSFLDGSTALSSPKCHVISRMDTNGNIVNFGNDGKCKNINDAYRKIVHKLYCCSIKGENISNLISRN